MFFYVLEKSGYRINISVIYALRYICIRPVLFLTNLDIGRSFYVLCFWAPVPLIDIVFTTKI